MDSCFVPDIQRSPTYWNIVYWNIVNLVLLNRLYNYSHHKDRVLGMTPKTAPLKVEHYQTNKLSYVTR